MNLIRVATSDNFFVDYDKSTGMYRVTMWTEYDGMCLENECWFNAYEEKEICLPSCSVGDIVWYTHYQKEPLKCKVSMLQQKADKNWKIRLTPPNTGVFDITMDEFNNFCFFTQKEAEENIIK